MKESFLRKMEKEISSIAGLDEVTSLENSDVKPGTCKSKALVEDHDLVEVKEDINISINNHALPIKM